MRISDMLRQYNQNVSNGTEELRSAQGTQKLVSTVGELSAGNVFEGTVNGVKGGKVTLALGNGQVITARLDGKVDIKPGTAMFFQVKENDGQTVAIRPYSGAGSVGNPILLDALTSAQVPVTDRALLMADAMMQEGMSINRENILAMLKYVNANPNANVQTIVQMVKLGLPVTEIMVSQYESYLSGNHSLVGELELAVNQLSEALADGALSKEEALALYAKITDIFFGEGAHSEGKLPMEGIAGAQTDHSLADGMGQQGAGAVPQNGAVQNGGVGALGTGGENAALGVFLSEEQLELLGKALQNIPVLAGDETLFLAGADGEIFVDTMQADEVLLAQMTGQTEGETNGPAAGMAFNKELTAAEFLQALKSALLRGDGESFAGLQKLFGGKEFQMLLREAVKEQWLLKPEEIKDGKRLTGLYEKLERQIGQLEATMRAAGLTQNSLLHTAAEIRGNIEFMNQINQIYHYVQLPLKMSGQSANGELYVYTNKKQQDGQEGEFSAFLHLDMENLGATDVSVRMQEKKVRTNFYFDNDAAYRLVEMHLPVLEKRLKNKGYECTITIANEKREINFKENFVKKGSRQTGTVHRYSFDVRA